jgi:putative aldouronate transport system permease protein
MIRNSTIAASKSLSMHKQAPLLHRLWQHRALLLMLLPGLIITLLFAYGPMPGLQIAFKDYKILSGIWGSPWVGLKYFQEMFSTSAALAALANTIIISLYRLFWGFPTSIILALLINELSGKVFKRVTQTLSYLPHFINWIVIADLIINILSPSTGVVNYVLQLFGMKSIYFMTNTSWFRSILVSTGIWKEVGWGSVLYLAALSNVDSEQVEAAIVDGANRLQRIRHISIPALVPIMSISLILSMSGILNAGFDQIFNMYNLQVFSVSDILDTYVYRVGMVDMNYSFSTAVGLFKSVVGLILVLLVNTITRGAGSREYGLW